MIALALVTVLLLSLLAWVISPYQQIFNCLNEGNQFLLIIFVFDMFASWKIFTM